MMEVDEEVINIPAIRHSYHLTPSKFAKETEGMDYEDKVMKLYHNIIGYVETRQDKRVFKWFGSGFNW